MAIPSLSASDIKTGAANSGASQATAAKNKNGGTSNLLTAKNAAINDGTTKSTVGTSGKFDSSNSKGVDTDTAAKTLSQNYDQFLKLLTTQMKNQDPLSPMDSAQFTSQLVQYSQVEQQIGTNKSLNNILAQLQTNQTLQAANFLGQTAEVKSDTVNVTKGQPVQFGYSFPTAVDSVDITITDSTGKQVARLKGPANSGHDTVVWDGKDENGLPTATGAYKITATGTTSGGAQAKSSSTSVVGMVQDVQIVDNKAQLMINGNWYQMTDIKSIKATPAAQAAAKDTPVPKTDTAVKTKT